MFKLRSNHENHIFCVLEIHHHCRCQEEDAKEKDKISAFLAVDTG